VLQNAKRFIYVTDILIYDYLDSRRYLWEDKVFMNDINILRQHGLLKRARVRTAGYRDYNSHQITLSGIDHIRRSGYSDSAQAKRILSYLTCPKCRSLLNVRLEKKAPVLLCPEKKHRQVINGFLKDMKLEKLNHTKPFFL